MAKQNDVVYFTKRGDYSSINLTEQSDNVTLSFHNIRYQVQKKLDDKPICGKTAMQDILCGVSGLLPPGLNAIMGPTGSGKSSLLDILAQRKDPKGLSDGLVLLNGERPPSNFRLMSGYVVQDDNVMGTLTVRENLAFSANLRLSNNMYDATARRKKVDEVIEQLGLQECADTSVGNEFVRGVSGGERKRVNIGMEMILDPPVLFLDEPTTGLDSNTANSIVLLLFKLAGGGRNIIISIHQPRYSIFSLFDRLIILHKGHMVYRGDANNAVNYFNDIGFACPRFHNPADFFLDVIGGDVNTAKLIERMNNPGTLNHSGSVRSLTNGDVWVKRMDALGSTNLLIPEENADNTDYLLHAFAKSTTVVEDNNKLQEIQNSYYSRHGEDSAQIMNKLQEAHYANGFGTQVNTVIRRTVLNIVRHPMTSVVQIFLVLMFGVLIGLIYFQSNTSFTSGIQNRVGCFFFLITIQVMANLSALELFIRNRAHFIHESASGYYRVSVYFIAQVFADLIPNRLIPNLIFSLIIYFMIGFQMNVGKFFFFAFVLCLSAVCASSLAFFVSASVRIFAFANLLVALPYILMMLFGGFLVNTGSMLAWLEWFKYVSIYNYGINALIVNEMSGLIFINDPSFPGFNASSSTPCISEITHYPIPSCMTGEYFMEMQDIEYGLWGMQKNVIALSTMSAGFLLLAYIQMRRVNKFK